MEKEDIEKAADDFADREYEYNDIDRNALYKGFYWGAQWRIKIVWHTYEEAKEVDLGKENIVIVMYPNNIYKIGKLSLYQHKKNKSNNRYARNCTRGCRRTATQYGMSIVKMQRMGVCQRFNTK